MTVEDRVQVLFDESGLILCELLLMLGIDRLECLLLRLECYHPFLP